MDISHQIRSFALLGEKISHLTSEEIDFLIDRTQSHNSWFTSDSVKLSLEGVSRYLQKESLEKWLAAYNITEPSPKQVGVVMAGNIPLVGFHDFLSVLISGHVLQAKLSSQAPFLLPHLAGLLTNIAPEFEKQIHFVDKLSGMDAVIATGSDNSARYFHYYFSKIPYVIRQNRTSVAVVTGEENEDEIKQLGKDIFQYYGLGCRNVAKVFVPQQYDFNKLLDSLSMYHYVLDHHKYANNYDYNKSIYLVNRTKHLDNGFLLLTESGNLVSPISVLYYEQYTTLEDLQQKIDLQKGKIQCVVSKDAWFPGSIPLGKAQKPELWDYADRVDTMDFLINLR